jgi:methionyl-tRNA formyltransferase
MTHDAEAPSLERIALKGPSRRLVLFGDPTGLPQLLDVVDRAAVVAMVGAAIRPEQHVALSELSARTGVPFLVQPGQDSPEMQDFARALEGLAPDLILVNSYSMILSPRLLSIPGNGAVNVHGALLPAYRGANPTEWALINGERQTGVTIHVMDSGIDTGPIIAQSRVPIAFEDTWIDVRRRVRAATEALLSEFVPAIVAGTAQAFRQPPDGRHWRRRKAADGAFDWDQPAVSIYNLIRALVAPHPGAVSPEGREIREWQSLPAIVWMKYGDGRRRWADPRWRVSACRPRAQRCRKAANAFLDLCISPQHGTQIGVCRISGLGRSAPAAISVERATRARISTGMLNDLHELVARFAAAELGQDVVFA